MKNLFRIFVNIVIVELLLYSNYVYAFGGAPLGIEQNYYQMSTGFTYDQDGKEYMVDGESIEIIEGRDEYTIKAGIYELNIAITTDGSIRATAFKNDVEWYKVEYEHIKYGAGAAGPILMQGGDISAIVSDVSGDIADISQNSIFADSSMEEGWNEIIKSFVFEWLQGATSFTQSCTRYLPDGKEVDATINIVDGQISSVSTIVIDEEESVVVRENWESEYADDGKIIATHHELDTFDKENNEWITGDSRTTYTYDSERNLEYVDIEEDAGELRVISKYSRDGDNWLKDIRSYNSETNELQYFEYSRLELSDVSDSGFQAVPIYLYQLSQYSDTGSDIGYLTIDHDNGGKTILRALEKPSFTEGATPEEIADSITSSAVTVSERIAVGPNQYVLYTDSMDQGEGVWMEYDEAGKFIGFYEAVQVTSSCSDSEICFAVAEWQKGDAIEDGDTIGNVKFISSGDIEKSTGGSGSESVVHHYDPKMFYRTDELTFTLDTGELQAMGRFDSFDENPEFFVPYDFDIQEMKEFFDQGGEFVALMASFDYDYTPRPESKQLLHSIIYIYENYNEWEGDTVEERSSTRERWFNDTLQRYSSELSSELQEGTYLPAGRPVTNLERGFEIASYVAIAACSVVLAMPFAIPATAGFFYGTTIAGASPAVAGAIGIQTQGAGFALGKLLTSSAMYGIGFGVIETGFGVAFNPEYRSLEGMFDLFRNGVLRGSLVGLLSGAIGYGAFKTGLPLFGRLAASPGITSVLPNSAWIARHFIAGSLSDKLALMPFIIGGSMAAKKWVEPLVIDALGVEGDERVVAEYVFETVTLAILMGLARPGAAVNFNARVEWGTPREIGTDGQPGSGYEVSGLNTATGERYLLGMVNDGFGNFSYNLYEGGASRGICFGEVPSKFLRKLLGPK